MNAHKGKDVCIFVIIAICEIRLLHSNGKAQICNRIIQTRKMFLLTKTKRP